MIKGLTSFQLKVIALVLMVFDHLHDIFVRIINFPFWFHIIGRLSAPLFVFSVANGMKHTRNPVKYLFRLWIGFVIMGIGNNIINKFVSLSNGEIIVNNIFGTLFLIALYIYCIQKITSGKSRIVYILYMIIPIISTLSIYLGIIDSRLLIVGKIIFTLVPSVLLCDGGPAFVILGVGMYLCKSKRALSIFYIIFSLIMLCMGISSNLSLKQNLIILFTSDVQWMMIFSLPLMLLYNGKRGRSMKYFFYIFYPAHIYGFALIAHFLS